jgi:tetratricopeptide (TPR) repeat protein
MSLPLSRSSVKFVVLSCAVLTVMFGLIASPALTHNTGESSFSPCDKTKTLSDYQKELKANPRSSLANYCEGGLLFAERRYEESGNAYHASLSGDGNPKWTKVWSYIQFGRIFDTVGESERAVEYYQLAIKTGDNTGNAMEIARDLLKHPFQRPATR